MRTVYSAAILLLATIAMAACEGSPYPLADVSDSSVDERLIGSWIMSDAPDDVEGESRLNIFAFDENAYYVEAWDEGDEHEMLRMNVFTTEVQGILFANIRCINCDEEDRDEYFFFNYRLTSEDELAVRGIDEDLYEAFESITSITDVRSFFERNVSDSDFFDDETAVYRRGKASS